MNLGGDKSHAVAEALAARGIPFAFSTGYSSHNGDIRAHPDRPVLRKPFQYKELVEMLARLLAR
jgi:hypothetical protein